MSNTKGKQLQYFKATKLQCFITLVQSPKWYC